MSEVLAQDTAVGPQQKAWRPLAWWQWGLLVLGACLSTAAIATSFVPEQASNILTGWAGNNLSYVVIMPALALLGWFAVQAMREPRMRRWALVPAGGLALCEVIGLSISNYGSLVWFDSLRRFTKGLVIFGGYFWFAYVAAACVLGLLIRPLNDRLPLLAPLVGRARRCRDWVENLVEKPRWAFIGLWAVIALSRVPYLIWLWPGCLSTDSLGQMNQALGYDALNNHHPVIHTLVIRLLVSPAAQLGNVSLGVGIYSIVQILVTSAAMAYAALKMLRWRTPIWLWLVGLAWFVVYPTNAIYAITMWKNIPFAAAMLVLTVMLIDLVKGPGPKKKWPWLVGFQVCLLAVFLFRSDGPIAAMLVALAAIILVSKQFRKRMLIGLLIGLGLAFVIRGPVIGGMGVEPGSVREALSVPLQQIARVSALYADELTPDQTQFVRELFGGHGPREIGAQYNPTISDPVKRFADNSYLSDNLGQFVSGWFDLGVQYPKAYLESFLANSHGYWYPEAFHWVVSGGISSTVPVPGLSPSDHATTWLGSAFNIFRLIPGVSMVFSIGFGFHLGLLALAALGATGRLRQAWCLAPLAAVWLVCLASPVFAEYRYAYGYLIALPVVLSLAFPRREPASSDRNAVTSEQEEQAGDPREATLLGDHGVTAKVGQSGTEGVLIEEGS
ncbi:MAG: DUF6020 family protein [Propionibacteriaceae bacterium]|jgi:hypothetical protein|nr:DUF6020 family protein [Propionibacteriaceae bacterium]